MVIIVFNGDVKTVNHFHQVSIKMAMVYKSQMHDTITREHIFANCTEQVAHHKLFPMKSVLILDQLINQAAVSEEQSIGIVFLFVCLLSYLRWSTKN